MDSASASAPNDSILAAFIPHNYDMLQKLHNSLSNMKSSSILECYGGWCKENGQSPHLFSIGGAGNPAPIKAEAVRKKMGIAFGDLVGVFSSYERGGTLPLNVSSLSNSVQRQFVFLYWAWKLERLWIASKKLAAAEMS